MDSKNEMAQAIREIPFRDIADDHKLNQEMFIKFCQKGLIGKVFLRNGCEEHFMKIFAKTESTFGSSNAQAYQEAIMRSRLDYIEKTMKSCASDEFKEYCDVTDLVLNKPDLVNSTGTEMNHGLVDFYLDVFFNADGLYKVALKDFERFVMMWNCELFRRINNI